jgi:lysozyme family protein
MADNFHGCLAFILKAEGGWSDDPSDHGGCTMRGITLQAYQAYRGNPALTCADLQQIGVLDVTAFYHDQYWVPLQAQILPLGVDLMVVDCAVNIGSLHSVELLQGQIGVTADGVIGPMTMTAVWQIDAETLISSLADAQSLYYQNLPQYAIFGEGWLNRVQAREAAALAMSKIS